MKYLKDSATTEGLLNLPTPLSYFKGAHGDCEHSIKVNSAILLEYKTANLKDKKDHKLVQDFTEDHVKLKYDLRISI